MWCAVHRSNLAWSDLTKQVSEVKRLITDAREVAKYFHTSGIRTAELHKITESLLVTLERFPDYFEIRWTEYVHSLLNTLFSNWHPLIKYVKSRSAIDAECRGFVKVWTEVGQLKLMVFLLDVLMKYSRFQKRL